MEVTAPTLSCATYLPNPDFPALKLFMLKMANQTIYGQYGQEIVLEPTKAEESRAQPASMHGALPRSWGQGGPRRRSSLKEGLVA